MQNTAYLCVFYYMLLILLELHMYIYKLAVHIDSTLHDVCCEERESVS